LLLFFAILPEINTSWVTYGLPLAMAVCFLLALASAGGDFFQNDLYLDGGKLECGKENFRILG
jgi:hypothetical protein